MRLKTTQKLKPLQMSSTQDCAVLKNISGYNSKFSGCAKLGEISRKGASHYMRHRKSYALRELKLRSKF